MPDLWGIWSQSWTIPQTSLTLRGFSVAAYRSGFYIPELDLMFDAGPQNFSRVSHLLVTHTHADHIAGLPFTVLENYDEDKRIEIFTPKTSEVFLREYLQSLFETNLCRRLPELKGYSVIPLEPKKIFRLTLKKREYQIETFACDHTVPTIGYGLSSITQKLKPEYLKLPGKEIGQLRKSGVEITHEQIKPIMTYLCDTSIQVFNDEKIFDYPMIMIECTFFDPDHYDNAQETKHVHWKDLLPIVQKHPDNLFMLFHLSSRYNEAEIGKFFATEKETHQLKNLRVWGFDL